MSIPVEGPLTAVDPEDFPEDALDEYLLLGRSNVGKSTFINTLLNRRIARISKTPGRTRTLNFYRVAQRFYLVDAPGYGYARQSKLERAQHGEMVENYLALRGVLRHAFLLVDCRHEPTEDDRLMGRYLEDGGVTFTLVATKADKIAKGRRKQHADKLRRVFPAAEDVVLYSKDGLNRHKLLELLGLTNAAQPEKQR